MISVFGRWYRRKFSDPDAAMLLILILLTTAVLLLWGGLIMPVLVSSDCVFTRLASLSLGKCRRK